MSYRMSVKVLRDFFLKATKEQIYMVIDDIHPADMLDVIKSYSNNKLDILNKLPDWMIASIIDEAEDEEKYELLNLFESIKQTDIVEEMASDELVDMLGTLESSEANKILNKMDKEDAEDLRELMSHASDTAGGIMAAEFLSIKDTMTVKNTLDFLKTEAPDAETSYYLYVLDTEGHLKGVVSLRDLVVSSSEAYISEIMTKIISAIPVNMNQEKVANIFRKYSYITMPVINSDDIMVGIITIDDIIYIIENKNTEDIHRLASLHEDEKITDSVKESIISRLPWIFLKLLTAIIASSIIFIFKGTVEKLIMLIVFIPIISSMGTNIGNQTLTIIIRGISLGDLTFENSKKVIYKEFVVGLCNSAAIGLVTTVLVSIWSKNIILGLVIGISMIVTISGATISGFLVPLTLKKLDKDPALFSTLLVTTITDVVAFSFFLGLATLIMPYL